MGICDRLKLIIEELKINQTEFARQIGISPGNGSDLFNGKVKPSSDALTRIYNRYNINIAWLLTGVGEIFLKDNMQSSENSKPDTLKDVLPIIIELSNFDNKQKQQVIDFMKTIQDKN